MVSYGAPVINFSNLQGEIALSQIPNNIFTANTDGRAPFATQWLITAMVASSQITLGKMDSVAKALIYEGLTGR